MAATLYFLHLKDSQGRVITGESSASGYEKQIELESLSWNLTAEHSPKQDDKVSTQLQYQNLTLTKFFDRSTPGLCQMLIDSGANPQRPLPFQTALVSVVDMAFGQERAGGVPVLEIKLDDGFIEDVKVAVSGSGTSVQVKETVTLSYRLIKLTYFQAGADRTSRGSGFYFEGEAASLDS